MGVGPLPAAPCSSPYNKSLDPVLASGKQERNNASSLGIFSNQFNYTLQLLIESFRILKWVSLC